ncbi:MAG: hypothetical protein ACKOYI_15730 [Actinomycetota bacterium]
MTTIHYGNFRFNVEDTDVLLRLQEPDLDMRVTYLKSDAKTTGEDVLYKFEYLDNQWFVIVNYPLLQEQIANAVEIYAEEHGFEAARYIPMENLVYCTLRDLCEAIESHKCEESA